MINRKPNGQFDYNLKNRIFNFGVTTMAIASLVIPSMIYITKSVDASLEDRYSKPQFISPEGVVTPTPTPTPTPIPALTQDEQKALWVVNSARYFTKSDNEFSIMQAKLHFLLSKESKHDYAKGHGDNGKAGGCLQYWEGTWTRMRTAMIKDGEAREIGTRYDCKVAIHTTAYAISKGWEKEWGPIFRNEIKI